MPDFSSVTETITLWGDKMDVVFASHHWPTWGRDRAVAFIEDQRDMVGFRVLAQSLYRSILTSNRLLSTSIYTTKPSA